MNVYSERAVIPLFAIVGFVVASPLFCWADETPSFSSTVQRLGALDGLRGFLALSVAIHHGTIYRDYLSSGIWRAPPSAFFNQLGQASVGLFFIITAYLFWGKTLRFKGVTDFAALLTGRVFRIAPVFCFLMLVASVSSFVVADFVVHEPPHKLIHEALQNFAFGIFRVTPFNGVNVPHMFADVTWTLVYEWKFYFALPFLAFLTRRTGRVIEIVLALLIITSSISWRTHNRGAALWTLFLWGILCATIKHRDLVPHLPNWVCSIVSLLTFSMAYALFQGTYDSAAPAALLGVGFYFIIAGGDLFGLLSLRASKRLGAVSYDLYLVHGLIFAAAFAVPDIGKAAVSSAPAYWCTLVGVLCIALAAALILHVAVEMPGLRFGRRIVSAFRSPRNMPGTITRTDQIDEAACPSPSS